MKSSDKGLTNILGILQPCCTVRYSSPKVLSAGVPTKRCQGRKLSPSVAVVLLSRLKNVTRWLIFCSKLRIKGEQKCKNISNSTKCAESHLQTKHNLQQMKMHSSHFLVVLHYKENYVADFFENFQDFLGNENLFDALFCFSSIFLMEK